MRRCPPRSVPAVLETAPEVQSAGRPSAHGAQCPQLGTKTSTTWSPFARSSTPSPSASTTPAASCPSNIGVGRGRSPLITERSEWHRPAAAIFTRTSPRAGARSSISSIASGRVLSYGGSTPIAFSTAPRIFMDLLPAIFARAGIFARTLSPSKEDAGSSNLDQEIRVEAGILVHAVPGVASRIAHHPRAVQDIVEAVVRVSMDPQASAASIGQVLGVGYEARVEERVREPRVDALR